MKILKGYRTTAIAVATILAGLAEMVGVINVVAPDSEGLVMLVAGIAGLVLRYLTDTPIGVSVKQEDEE
jgi:hypothetical protein